MYEVGTLLLYYRRGVYEIEGVGAPPLPKEDESVYYKLRSAFSTNNEMIYIPVEADEFIRPLIRGEKVPEYLEWFSQMEPPVFNSRKSTELIGHYRDMLASCRLEDCLLLIKEINAKQKELSSHNKRLGQVDQQYLKLAERLVCEEFAAVSHTEPEAVKKSLYAAMRRRPAPRKGALS